MPFIPLFVWDLRAKRSSLSELEKRGLLRYSWILNLEYWISLTLECPFCISFSSLNVEFFTYSIMCFINCVLVIWKIISKFIFSMIMLKSSSTRLMKSPLDGFSTCGVFQVTGVTWHVDSFGIGATIRTHREIQCLPFAGLFSLQIIPRVPGAQQKIQPFQLWRTGN